MKVKIRIFTLRLATFLHVKELDRGTWSSNSMPWNGALGSGLAAPSPHPSKEEDVLPQAFTPKEGEGFLGQTLPQHKAGSLWRPAEPHKALCSPIKRSLVTCWKSYLTTTATASHCYWTLNTSIILIAPCHWQRSPFSFKAFEELACNRPTGLNRLSES